MNTEQLSQTKTLDTNQPVQPELKQTKRRQWRRVGLVCFLLLGTTALCTALHLVAPTIPGRAENLPDRIGWYLAQGQWRADSRTIAAVWNYWMQSPSEAPVPTDVTNLPVATTPTESLPKS